MDNKSKNAKLKAYRAELEDQIQKRNIRKKSRDDGQQISLVKAPWDRSEDKFAPKSVNQSRPANFAKVLWQFLAHFQEIEEILAHF